MWIKLCKLVDLFASLTASACNRILKEEAEAIGALLPICVWPAHAVDVTYQISYPPNAPPVANFTVKGKPNVDCPFCAFTDFATGRI
jgi:hypothetical protein